MAMALALSGGLGIIHRPGIGLGLLSWVAWRCLEARKLYEHHPSLVGGSRYNYMAGTQK